LLSPQGLSESKTADVDMFEANRHDICEVGLKRSSSPSSLHSINAKAVKKPAFGPKD